MTKSIKWNAGPPPHIGWWLCDSNWWRWWDGDNWGHGVHADAHASTVRRAAAKPIPVKNRENVRWCRYWPADARRPRLGTSDGHWTFNTDGRQPAYAGRIEVIYRDGWKIMGDNDRVPDASVWKCNQDNLDIVAWRPPLPEARDE